MTVTTLAPWCRNGKHRMTEDNIYTHPTRGYRGCRACKRENGTVNQRNARERARRAPTRADVPSRPAYTGQEPCIDYPELFYPETPEDWPGMGPKARAMCESCPIKAACAEWGIHRERYGIWGGLMPKERETIRKENRIRLNTPDLNIDSLILLSRAQTERWQNDDLEEAS